MAESTDPPAGATAQGAPAARVVVLSRSDCCLCDEALAAVEAARRIVPFSVEVVDVDDDPALAARYGHEVPVVLVDGRKAFKYRLTSDQLLRRLKRRSWLRVF